MDITLDIGAAVLGVVTVAVIPTVAWLLNRSHRERLAQEKRYEETKEAVDIHALLTEPQVVESLARASDEPGDTLKESLIALHRRSTVRYVTFKGLASIGDDLFNDIEAALTNIHRRWPTETAESQARFTDKIEELGISRPMDAGVQKRVLEFATELAGEDVALGGEPRQVRPKYQDVLRNVRVTSRGQGMFMDVPGGDYEIWFSGSGSGVVPTEIRHRHQRKNLRSCTLASVKPDSLIFRLQDKSESGARLANAFADELRNLVGPDGTDKCGCGVPFVPARSEASPAQS